MKRGHTSVESLIHRAIEISQKWGSSLDLKWIADRAYYEYQRLNFNVPDRDIILEKAERAILLAEGTDNQLEGKMIEQ